MEGLESKASLNISSSGCVAFSVSFFGDRPYVKKLYVLSFKPGVNLGLHADQATDTTKPLKSPLVSLVTCSKVAILPVRCICIINAANKQVIN